MDKETREALQKLLNFASSKAVNFSPPGSEKVRKWLAAQPPPIEYPGKSLTVGGEATVTVVNNNQLIIEGGDGLTVATVTDTRGNVVYMHHPLSGWYIEIDMRKEEEPS